MLYPSKKSGPPPKEPHQPRIHTYDVNTKPRRMGRIFTILNILLLMAAIGVYVTQKNRTTVPSTEKRGSQCLAQFQRGGLSYSLRCSAQHNQLRLELSVQNNGDQPKIPFAQRPAELKIISRLDGQALYYQKVQLGKQTIPAGGILGKTFSYGPENWPNQSVLKGSFDENVRNLIAELVVPEAKGAKLLRLEIAKFLQN